MRLSGCVIRARSFLGDCSMPRAMSASDTRLPVRRSGNERTFDDTEEEDEASAIRIQIKRENMFSETTKHKVQEEEEDEEGGGRREEGRGRVEGGVAPRVMMMSLLGAAVHTPPGSAAAPLITHNFAALFQFKTFTNRVPSVTPCLSWKVCVAPGSDGRHASWHIRVESHRHAAGVPRA